MPTSPNIAALPHYSPFRYPGGKTWLIPAIRKWLATRPKNLICEPFAGGASASLMAVLEGYVERAILIEKDEGVASVWKTILSPDAEELVDRILKFSISKKSVTSILNSKPRSQVSIAFQTILKNRCRRGGNLSNSAGLLVRGERDQGLSSRWYPETLAKRICQIHQVRKQIHFVQGDGVSFIKKLKNNPGSVKIFIDPPYPELMNSGVRPLYTHYELDHENLFKLLMDVEDDFLLTYADSKYVKYLAGQSGFQYTKIAMRNLNAQLKQELLITPSK